MSETIWWCVEHKSALASVWKVMPVVNPTCEFEVASETALFCRMVERRLVSPTALVIPTPWPEWAIDRAGITTLERLWIASNLASSQGVEP